VPEAGLDSMVRDKDIAHEVVKKIVAGADPTVQLVYNGAKWRSASNNTIFGTQTDWLQTPVHLTINGRRDVFSQRLVNNIAPFLN